jgi:DNA-binding transcriptional ArsR family regulator
VKVLFHIPSVNPYGVAMAPRPASRRALTLEDPRAIRALAHEARQQVIEELYNGAVLTATEAARLCGITPSAMSYHLRALEKWGIVARDESSSDARERPWRAAADHLNIGPEVHRQAGPVAARAFFATYLQSVHRAVDAWAVNPAGHDGEKSAQLSRGRVWLDDEEAEALNREIDAVIARYDTRTPDDHPDGTTARDFFWMNLPRRATDA